MGQKRSNNKRIKQMLNDILPQNAEENKERGLKEKKEHKTEHEIKLQEQQK